MTTFPFQSFLFAFVLLISVMISAPENGPPSAHTSQAALDATVLATVSPTPPEATLAPRATFAAVLPPPMIEPLRAAVTPPDAVPAHTSYGVVFARRTPLAVTPEVKALPKIDFPLSAVVAFAKDITSGEVLVEKESSKRWAIASLTKLMTALVVTEAWDSAKKITITEHALAAEGTAGNFAAGEVYRARELVATMLLSSSNDAAQALADAYGNDALVDAMQVKARAIGMENTAFADVTGISYLNQSTARDLALLARYLFEKHPALLEDTAYGEVTLTELKTGKERTIVSIHPFARRPHFLGGKTGYTDEARGNLISLFEVGDRIIFVLVLGSADRTKDTTLLYDFITGS